MFSSLADLLLILYYWKAIGDKYFVTHHVAALYAYYYVLVSAIPTYTAVAQADKLVRLAMNELFRHRALM